MNIAARIALLAMLSLLPDGICFSREPDKGIPATVRINVAARNANDGKSQLDVDLEYIGDKAVRIFESNLPWGIRRSLLLVAVCLDGKRSQITELEYIDDPTPSVVSLQPGQAAHGSIDLSDRFPKLGECLAKRDALIFWSYEFIPIDGNASPRLNGGVQISKRGR